MSCFFGRVTKKIDMELQKLYNLTYEAEKNDVIKKLLYMLLVARCSFLTL